MNLRAVSIAASVAVFVLTGSGVTQAALNIEQAEQLSKRTGRPILAVAGSKT